MLSLYIKMVQIQKVKGPPNLGMPLIAEGHVTPVGEKLVDTYWLVKCGKAGMYVVPPPTCSYLSRKRKIMLE